MNAIEKFIESHLGKIDNPNWKCKDGEECCGCEYCELEYDYMYDEKLEKWVLWNDDIILENMKNEINIFKEKL
jgi:hypothetical protein